MTSRAAVVEHELSQFTDRSVDKMPAHWLMARLGKRVLRPGGVGATQWLLKHVSVQPSDDVIEFAPGLGSTAREIVALSPNSYVGVERDAKAKILADRSLADSHCPNARIIQGDALHVPLENGCATIVLGEAMLSMQTLQKKQSIIAEARRLLRANGRYALHELAVIPENIDREQLANIHRELSEQIHVGVRIGTVDEWTRWVTEAGFEVESITTKPMHLLEPRRLIQDEGLFGACKFVFNALTTPGARRRLLQVRSAFRKYNSNLCAIALVARRIA